ncbi:Calx-beta domain-containing protein, partial [Rhabdothermincola sp.]|uniref:Calx-beta domain-containing protein n=1 Tax=Rhabdothermincola sp. TaxID=2820405 RepID=UPI002FE363AA
MTALHDHPHPSRFRATRWAALAFTALLLAALAVLVPGSPVQGSGSAVASVGDVSVVEGDTGTRVVRAPLTLSEPSPGPQRVVVTVAAGTATVGVDFKKAYSRTVAFKAGQTSKTVSVAVLPDTIAEGDETVTVTLSSPSSGLTIGVGTATVTIRDDDTPPPP